MLQVAIHWKGLFGNEQVNLGFAILDILAIGEILVDMIPTKPGHYSEVPAFEKCFGGAPFNFAVGASRLGSKVGALCAVGADPFGEFLLETLSKNGIDISHVKVKKARTTLAFVVRHEDGERAFFFYRKPWAETADTLLSPEDLDPKYIESSKVLHYSGVALSHSPLRECVKRAVNVAKEAGVKVSFDPNIRLDLWESPDSLKDSCYGAFQSSDIILLAKDEMEYFYGKVTPREAADQLFKKYDPLIVAIKLGGDGCYVRSREGFEITKPAFKVAVVDTTGAGDGWAAGFLHGLVKGWDLEKCSTVANAVGGLVVTKIGAITAMPTKSELLRFLRSQGMDIVL
jgi:sugar/nucleoside kinase (ribokinase family)